MAAPFVVLTAVVWESLGNSTKLHAQRDRTQTDPSCFYGRVSFPFQPGSGLKGRGWHPGYFLLLEI